MSNTAADQEMPKVVILGGITYDVESNPSLKNFVSSVIGITAAKEKNKLYTQFEELREKVVALSKVEVAPIVAPVDTKADWEKQKKEIIAEMSAEFKQTIAPFIEKQNINDAAAINNYRLKLLSENQGKCIAELVVGNTVAELDANLAKATELLKTYAPPVTTQGQPPVSTPPAQTTPPVVTTGTPPVVAAPVRVDATLTAAPDIKNMSQDDFAKQRAELLKQVEATLKNGSAVPAN